MELPGRLVVTCLAACGLLSATAVSANQHSNAAEETHDYQLRRLMQPSPAELTTEQKGGIYIYDSLEINQVNAALDNHFDRIQHMMFTRINHLPPTGAGPAMIEDDGCD